MFKTIKNALKTPDVRKRILYTLLLIVIFRLGCYITVPGVNSITLNEAMSSNNGVAGLIDMISGGAFSRFSVFAMSISPYITASIVVQLLQMDIIPYFAELSKQGGTGRTKLNQITRYLGIALAFIQGYMYSFAFVKGGTPIEYMMFALILTAGTSLLLWLGDQITAKGIGNGISLIIMAGIIATMPNMFIQAWDGMIPDGATTQQLAFGITKFVLFVIMYIAIILGVVFVETSERRIPIQYANKSTSSKLAKQNYIPFKLNSAGVIPVIFASAIISIPGMIASALKNDGFTLFVNKWLTMTTPTGFIIYVLCIFAFAYFYTFLQLKPKELAENLNQNGGFIPGVRPGDETVNYVSKVLKRITTVGALSLVIIAAIPIIFGAISSLPSSVRVGGTSLLIVVGVALETYKQLDSELITRSHTRGRRR